MEIDGEIVVELLERVARLEEKQAQAENQQLTMSNDLKDIKVTLLEIAQEQKVKDAKFGTLLWAASAMVTAVTTVVSLVIQWFKHAGTTGGP